MVTGPLEGIAANLLDPDQVLDRILDLQDHALFDFLRRRTEIRHAHLDHVEFERRLHFLADVAHRQQTADDNQDH